MYTKITNLVDTSTTSLAIAAVVFILVTFITKYLLESYEADSEEKRNYYLTLIYALIIGLIFTALTLVIIKQINLNSGDDILRTPFPSS